MQESKAPNNAESRYLKRFAKWLLIVVGLSIFLLFSMAIHVAIGPMSITVENALGIILHQVPILGNLVNVQWTSLEEAVVVQLRLPRVLSAVLAGIALSIAGTVFQGLFKNPMADPYMLGLASGAGFGASLAIVLGFGLSSMGAIYAIPLMASIGAISTMFLVYGIARTSSGIPVLRLLLAGMSVGSFFSALIWIMMVIAGESAHVLVFWLFGGFTMARWEHICIAAPVILLGFIAIYAVARDLNIMLLGEDQARQLGVEVETVKKLMLVLASVVTAAAVSISGAIGFVGLIIPHMMRILVGPDHRILLPSSALAGAILLVLCDSLTKEVASVGTIGLPIGVITAMLGCPFFIYLLIRSKKIRM